MQIKHGTYYTRDQYNEDVHEERGYAVFDGKGSRVTEYYDTYGEAEEREQELLWYYPEYANQ